jgi:hypothetical protein
MSLADRKLLREQQRLLPDLPGRQGPDRQSLSADNLRGRAVHAGSRDLPAVRNPLRILPVGRQLQLLRRGCRAGRDPQVLPLQRPVLLAGGRVQGLRQHVPGLHCRGLHLLPVELLAGRPAVRLPRRPLPSQRQVQPLPPELHPVLFRSRLRGLPRRLLPHKQPLLGSGRGFQERKDICGR